MRSLDGNCAIVALARRAIALVTIILFTPAITSAGIPLGEKIIRLETVASGFVSPIMVAAPNDGSNRLFVADQVGPIWIVENGVRLPTPFLDLSTEIPALTPAFDERGVLGMAFHPNYAGNGRFFVRYSRPRTSGPLAPCTGTARGCHEEVLAEFTVSAEDPNIANPTPRILFRIDEPQFNHNSGGVEFGPDGFLYFALGDGGGANDSLNDANLPHTAIGNGQNIETALGALLRINVNAGNPYAIPPDNPFVGRAGVDEIYAYGLRNPFRFCFDDGPGGDGTLYLGDVGQAVFEELNIIVRGGNYGWAIREGAHCFDPFNPNTPLPNCDTTDLIDPIAEYTHAEGGLSIIVAYVYRGSQNPSLTGTLILGDFAGSFASPTGRLYYLENLGEGQYEIREFRITTANVPYGKFLKSFGRDADGEIYVCGSTLAGPSGSTGVVQRIVGVVPGDMNCDGLVTPGDIAGFVLALTAPKDYAMQFLDCDAGNGDINGDGLVTPGDIAGFVSLLTGS